MLTLSLLTQHIVYQLSWWVVRVSDQSCYFMQDGVSDEDVKFTEVEQTLSGMGRPEKLVLGIDYDDDEFKVTNCSVSSSFVCTLLSLLCNHCMPKATCV